MDKKKVLVILAAALLLAAGCDKITLKTDVPSSPAASYQQLPR